MFMYCLASKQTHYQLYSLYLSFNSKRLSYFTKIMLTCIITLEHLYDPNRKLCADYSIPKVH